MKIDYDAALKQLNERLEKDGFTERFILKTDVYDGYISLVIENPIEVLPIVMTRFTYPSGKDEWTIEYLGTQDSVSGNISLDLIYDGYIKNVLNNRIVAMHYFDEDYETVKIGETLVPETISFGFSAEERQQAMKKQCLVVCWSGKITDETILSYVFSEREDVKDFKYGLFSEIFDKFFD